MPYIYSTLTASNTYVKYNHDGGGGDLPSVDRSVTVKGGSNLPSRHMLTSIGFMTDVSDEDYSWLQNDEVFKLHVKNGYIKVRDRAADSEKVASDMVTRDQSAPLVEQDFSERPPVPNTDGITGSAKPVGSSGDDRPKNNRRA